MGLFVGFVDWDCLLGFVYWGCLLGLSMGLSIESIGLCIVCEYACVCVCVCVHCQGFDLIYC